MNERVQERLNKIENYARELQSMCKSIIMDVDDVRDSNDSSDLMVVESNFARIMRTAEDAYDYVQDTYDEF